MFVPRDYGGLLPNRLLTPCGADGCPSTRSPKGLYRNPLRTLIQRAVTEVCGLRSEYLPADVIDESGLMKEGDAVSRIPLSGQYRNQSRTRAETAFV